MTGFSVETTTVQDAGSSLAPGTSELLAHQGAIAGLSGLADDTAGGEGFETMVQLWSTAIPALAASNESIASALTLTAAAYSDSDGDIAAGYDGSPS